MDNIEEVTLDTLSVEVFAAVVGRAKVTELERRAGVLRQAMAGRVLWNVNSTAAGGGVAEMLQAILPYVRGAGLDARWVVLRATADFFQVTKRLHNALHGFSGNGTELGAEERERYEARLRAVARDLI